MASALHEAGAIGGIITLPSRRRVDEPDRDILFNCSPRGATDGALWRSTPLSDTWGCPWSAEATGRTSQTSAGTGGRTWPIISCQISLGVHMADHDPLRFATSLGAKLATRSRHVCVFLGAGAGAACGLPDMEGLQQQVLQQLTDQDRVALKTQLAERTLEQVLTRLRRISALISGEEVVDSLTAARAQTLDAAVCHAIVTALNVNAVNPAPTRSFAALAVGLAGARLRCSTGLVPGRGGGVTRARVGRGCRRRVGGHLRRNGRICRSSARTAPAPHHHASGLQVAAGRLAPDPGRPLDPPQRPAEASQGEDLLSFVFGQDVAHARQEHAVPDRRQRLGALSEMAGFQVSTNGRFLGVHRGTIPSPLCPVHSAARLPNGRLPDRLSSVGIGRYLRGIKGNRGRNRQTTFFQQRTKLGSYSRTEV